MQTYALFTQPANRSVSQIRSGILGVRIVICRWSDQIFMSRQHWHILTGLLWSQCRRRNYVHWWCSFTNWCIVSHLALEKQSCCQAAEFISDCCSLCCLTHCSAGDRLYSTWLLWCTSVSLDLMSLLFVTLPVRQKTLWNLIWAARVSGLRFRFELHFKPTPNVFWFAKFAFNVFVYFVVMPSLLEI